MMQRRIPRIALTTALISAALLSAGQPAAAPPRVFNTPELAWQTLLETFQTGDWAAVEALLGPAARRIPLAGRTPQRLQKTAEDAGKAEVSIEVDGPWATFVVSGRPFPVSAQKTAKGWVLAENNSVRDKQAALVNQLKCITNLRAIQTAVQEYQRKNGAPPPSIESLVKDAKGKGALDPAALLCPLVGEGKHRAGVDDVACDYLYIPVPTGPGAPANAILAFCPRWNHPDGVRTCAFADGRADKIEKESEFRKALRAGLQAAGISVDAKAGATPPPAGSPALDPEWRKAVRAELGLERPPALKTAPPPSEGKAKKKS